MSWIAGSKCKKNLKNFNSYVKELKGDLDDTEARITLIQFLKNNIGLTFELISNTRLLPFQEIILQGLFQKDNGLMLGGRGASKSYLIACFSCLYPIFNPNSKVCLLSNSFRGSRRIFEQMEKIVRGKGAELLGQCFPNDPKRLNDIYKWVMPNNSEVFALPLSTGSNLRGTRASCVFLDEGLLIDKNLQQTIIRPFLTAKQNYLEELQIREQEDKMIAGGILKEEDRISFPKNKFLIMSSASYDFEYLADVYREYIQLATEEPKEKDGPTYFVMRLSYEALPDESFLDKTAIESAKANGGETSDYFLREYCARIISGSDGYFSVKKMHKCTVPTGQFPVVQIKGFPDAKYILTIDPSYSASKSSDFFAMSVHLLSLESRNTSLINSYGRAGGDIKDHYEYLVYVLTQFNIVWISIDASGTEFIDGFNESTIARDRNLKLEYFSVDLEKDDSYLQNMRQIKREYNITSKKFVYCQNFTSDSIRKMNEHLQNGISAEKVWFASKLSPNDEEFNKAMKISLPYEFKDKFGQKIDMLEFIESQDDWIDQTKSQLALIEVKSTALGTLQYDLPQHMKRSQSDNRVHGIIIHAFLWLIMHLDSILTWCSVMTMITRLSPQL